MQNYVLSELDSGERIITEQLEHVRSVALGFWIGAGSRDETDSKAGITHFIEHLLFKGSKSYTALQIAEIFDGLGGELNAATSREHTVVYARVPDGVLGQPWRSGMQDSEFLGAVLVGDHRDGQLRVHGEFGGQVAQGSGSEPGGLLADLRRRRAAEDDLADGDHAGSPPGPV